MLSTVFFLASIPLIIARAEGELEHVYNEFHRAILNSDIDQFKKCAPAEKLEQINATSPDKIKLMMELAQKLLPKDIVVIEEHVNADAGVLLVTGTDSLTGKKRNATVDFIKQGGQWKIKQEHWEVPDSKD